MIYLKEVIDKQKDEFNKPDELKNLVNNYTVSIEAYQQLMKLIPTISDDDLSSDVSWLLILIQDILTDQSA